MLGSEPREAHLDDAVDVEVGDGAAQAPATAQVDVDVHRGHGPSLGHRRGDLGQRCRLVDELAGEPPAELARWEHAAAPLLAEGLLTSAAEHQVAQHPVADAPLHQAVELDGQAVGDLLALVDQDDLEPLAEELLDGVLEEGDQGRELDVTASRGQLEVGQRGRCRPRPGSRPGACERCGVERERRRGDEVLRVEALQRVVPQRTLLATGHRGVEGVEELAERHGGRALVARRLVGAGVGDDEVLGGRGDRVEHQLAVLAARVSLPGEGAAGEHVVAVDRAGPREDAVVEAEQADHAVRDRAHRHQRGHGQGAGAEVGAGRASGEALPHQRAYVGQPQLEPGPRRGIDHGAELTVHLGGLPLVPASDRGQRLDPLAHGPQPVADGMAAGEVVGDPLQPVQALAEPAGEVDAGAAHVVERQGRAEEAVGVVADRHPREDAVEAEAPGVLHVALEPERLAVVGVEGPADAGALHPAGDRLEVGVGEAEPATHGLGGEQVEHPARLGPTTREVEQLAHDGEQAGWSGSASGRPAGRGARGPGGGRCRPSRRRRRSAARRTRCPGTSP